MVSTDNRSMRYWTRLIIVGLVFLVLGGNIIGGFQNKAYAACPSGEIDLGGGNCAPVPPPPNIPKIPDTDDLGYKDCKGNADCNAAQEAFFREERARGMRDGKNKVTDIGRCINKGYSDLYCDCKINHKGIYLNTEVPFVGLEKNPKCLVPDGNGEAGANVLTALTKILMTFVLIGGFGALVRAGVMIASSGGDDGRKTQGMKLIKAVVIAFALLGSLGVILRFINPNFFT